MLPPLVSLILLIPECADDDGTDVARLIEPAKMSSKDWAAPNLPKTPNRGTTHTPMAMDSSLQKELSRLDASVPFNPQTKYLHSTWVSYVLCGVLLRAQNGPILLI